MDLLIALNLVTHSEVGPFFEGNTALGIFSHFSDVLLDVLERNDGTWKFS